MDYGIYLATVVETVANDHRIGVKIIPQMNDIVDSSCPRWPSFFKDEMTLPKKGELVWVICNNDFSLGYVLGLANLNTYRGESFEEHSIPQSLVDQISSNIQDIQIGSFTIVDAKVEFWNDTTIHFIERSTGGRIMAFSNGTMYIFRPNEVILKLGAGASNVFKLTSEGFSLFSKSSIKLNSDNVTLGNNPTGGVLVSLGNEAGTATTSKSVQA